MSNMKELALNIQESGNVNYLPLQYFFTTTNEGLIPRSQGHKFVFSPPCKIGDFDFQRTRIQLTIVKSPYGQGAETAQRSCVTFSTLHDRHLMSQADRDGLEEAIEKAHKAFRQPVHLLRVKDATIPYFCGIWSALDPITLSKLGIEIESTPDRSRLKGYAMGRSEMILD